MAVPIGISVGDFIATIQLLKDIANALGEHGGAQSHYQHTVRNLETVQALLSSLESFHSKSGQTTRINAIRAQAQAIHSEVENFIQKIQKFRTTLGPGAPLGKRYGVIDKLKWSRKHTKEVEKLSKSIDVQLRNIQVLLDLDLSERNDLALEHNQRAASNLASLPTRQELSLSTSQMIDEMYAAERSIGYRVGQAEETLLRRLDSLERSAQKTTDHVAKSHEVEDLRAYIDSRLTSIRQPVQTEVSARLVLTLTIPQLHLSRRDVAVILGQLSDELAAILQALSIWVGSMIACLVLLVPQLILFQRTLRRLPAAISLALHDNMTFEDALGRLHSLQYQQFRHWKVFESSLHCIFADTPGFRKILQGHFVLTPENQPAIALTATNYSALVRPGYAFKMSMAMKKVTVLKSNCPKGCNGNVEKVSALEHRCKVCKLQYFISLMDISSSESAELGSQELFLRSRTLEADASKRMDPKAQDLAKSAVKIKASKPDEEPQLDPLNSALVLWRPPPYDPRELVDRWERACELAELKFFKRIHVKTSNAQSTNDYFERFFRTKRELGRGHRGVVLLVEHVLDGVTLGRFACKRVPVGSDHIWLEKMLVEAETLTKLSHKNLVSYRHVWYEEFRLSKFGPSVPCAYILQQYCDGGNLFDYMFRSGLASMRQFETREHFETHERSLRKTYLGNHTTTSWRVLSSKELYSFFKDITAGLRYLHQQGHVHGKLRPTNLLLRISNGIPRVCVSDFSEVSSDPLVYMDDLATDTIGYHAPEVVRQTFQRTSSLYHTTKSDIFSLGMIFYFLIDADLPYGTANTIDENSDPYDQLREEIVSWSGFDYTRMRRTRYSSQVAPLLAGMLSSNPDLRPTAEEVFRFLNLDLRDGFQPLIKDQRNFIDEDSDTGG